MATAKKEEEAVEPEEAPELHKEKPDVVPAEAKSQAKANLKKLNEDRAKGPVDRSDFSQPRTKQGARDRTLTVSKIKVPDTYDYDGYGPTGIAAVFANPETGDLLEITGEQDTQEFFIDEEKARYFVFAKAGQNLPKKRLYTIKGLHRDGTLVQLPAEQQIQNNAGGDEADMIGLRRYQRKGILVLIDWETAVPLYCAAWGCFAQAEDHTSQNPGFCSMRHAKHTLPNMYKNAGQIVESLMEAGVTTSRTWSAD